MSSSVTSPDGTVVGFETDGDGPPMVLVHGTGADHTRWAAVRERLGRRYRLHLLDRRGRGLSRAEAAVYDIRREGEDIAAVAEAAGGDVYVVAHSYGALCALEAVQVTDAISGLVAYEPPRPEPGRRGAPARPRGRRGDARDAGMESPGYLRLAAQAVAERIPGADVVPMRGQAHQAMDFDPDQFTEAVFAFGTP